MDWLEIIVVTFLSINVFIGIIKIKEDGFWEGLLLFGGWFCAWVYAVLYFNVN